ncbi:hypothetical protein [Nocardia aurantia]|uniref:Uncharacterized protein n=1 Tax=Nocardia aurantia TaxID=2585199 RepID=A0A7K0DNT1_9NOCA|nr:hypothetical protein [Nocardia aurantia]MQY27405.1 hypothetical protein [Nocardia aurantia]
MWVFDPTAGQDDFDAVPGLRAAWGDMLDSLYNQNINGHTAWKPGGTDPQPFAIQELTGWGLSSSDLRFFNPLVIPVPDDAAPVNVNWNALPTSFDARFGGNTTKIYQFLDTPQKFPGLTPPTRIQDEYCEWVVTRDAAGKLTKVAFTSEPPEYYSFLHDPPEHIDPKLTRALLVELYRTIANDTTVELADLEDTHGNYDPWNKWNNAACVHMQQPNNSLGAEVNIAARAAILRRNANGKLKTDADDLIQCAQYGDAARQSDPTIGAAVNAVARAGKLITLANPVGLYMASLDTTGWTTPDGTDPQTFWNVTRGSSVGDESKNMIVHAELSVPPDKGYQLSDLEIAGTPLAYGGQIAARIKMRLGVLVGPASQRPAPRAIGCLGARPEAAPKPHAAAFVSRASSLP